VPALATGTGDIPVEYPVLSVGYFDKNWEFQPFEGTPAIFNMSLDNLKAADKLVAVSGATLTGNLSTITQTDVSGKKIAVLNHVSTFKMMPGRSTSPFPSIWLKSDNVNPDTSDGKPANYLSGTDANKFFQMGLVVQAPFWENRTYQWSVYVYADKDVLTQTAGPATGKVLDPRKATMRWFAWADNQNGILQKMWKEKTSDSAPVNAFNTLPLIIPTGTDPEKAAALKAFLTGTSGASLPDTSELGDIAGSPTDPSTAPSLVYNTLRNTAAVNNGNGIQIIDRSQAGLAYVAPGDAFGSHRTEYVHLQFVVKWPNGVGLSTSGSKSCDIGIYRKTTD
jgi:hypothetical protein